MEIPFDGAKLDALLDEAAIDLALVTSKHNVQYLLGGYRFFFFECRDAIGLDRYLPVVGYVSGQPETSFYVGAGNEAWQQEIQPLWVAHVSNTSWSAYDSAMTALRMIKQLFIRHETIAVEPAFLPTRALQVLRDALPESRFVDATTILEAVRAVKSTRELALIREASEGIVASMLAAFRQASISMTEQDLVERVRREETNRGLTFEYCLITSGKSLNRAPSLRRLQQGEIISLDSAGHLGGYIGDMARMGVLGTPTSQMYELLEEIASVQAAARMPIRQGEPGASIYTAALEQLEHCPNRERMTFLAHGVGLIPHEAPRLTSTGPIPYPADHRDQGLEAGMVLSIETHMLHPTVGFIKLEDTVVVTETGWEAFADDARNWNIAGN